LVALLGASVGAGLAEAGVLALVAEAAAAMVLGGHRLHLYAGPLSARLGVGLGLGVALGLALSRLALQLVIAWLQASISSGVQARLRRELFAAFTGASWAVQSQDREGQLQELMTSQINQAGYTVSQVIQGVSGTVMFIVLVGAAGTLNAIVALIVLACAVALFWLLRPVARFGRRASSELSRANLDHAAGVNEAAGLAEEAHVFGAGAAQRQHVGELIESSRRATFRYTLSIGVVGSAYQSLVILLIVAGLAGLYLANAGNLAVLGAVVLMLVRSSSYAQQFQSGVQALNQMLPYLERIEGGAARYRASAPAPGYKPLPAIRTLAFQGVTFSYGRGQPALRGVSFIVDAGEAIGIAGPSGAGKSTLVQLLLRLREPGQGAYLVNGEPAHLFLFEDWHDRVAYVPQEPRLVYASVAENIRFFRDLDDAAVESAARAAHIHDHIVGLPDGYRTVIGQRADAVSGGQRQRICLARALAANPDVLVLDEPTSALDPASEAAVQASLGALHGAVTIFIVSHRLSTLARSDRVLRLTDGAVSDFAPLSDFDRRSDGRWMAATPVREK
jgi:ABC-type multidrug transport system fused ATPase/permease subunit